MTELEQFATDIGPVEPVTCVGGRTQWGHGGSADQTAREVVAPTGVVQVIPEEMIVRVRAGTPLTELHQALAEVKQRVALPSPTALSPQQPVELDSARAAGTVGGALAVAHGGWRQLRLGPPRDCVMEVTYVTAAGELSKSGGPVVKNVSGFDLCRLLVGAFGTLGFMAEFVLRASPVPEVSQWFSRELDRGDLTLPNQVQDAIHAPGSILCTDSQVFVLLEGHSADVAADHKVLSGLGFAETSGEPPKLGTNRWSARRGSELISGRGLDLDFVALTGTGILTTNSRTIPTVTLDPVAARMNRKLKERFDPTGRLNPGRDPLFGIGVGNQETAS